MDITNNKIIFDYDINKFNFYDIFIKHLSSFDVDNLQNLHSLLPKSLLPKEVVNVENDQAQPFYKILYNVDKGYDLNKRKPSGVFLETYKDFVYYLSSKIFKEKLIYQSKPTIRVHFPGNKSVGGFHRDRDYNHPIEEINIWVPITPGFNTNTIWIESEFGKEDFTQMNLNFGQGVIFDSGLSHGNKVNIENLTRLSFDFRVIPISKWKNDKNQQIKSSIDQNLKFKVNEYYTMM